MEGKVVSVDSKFTEVSIFCMESGHPVAEIHLQKSSSGWQEDSEHRAVRGTTARKKGNYSAKKDKENILIALIVQV